MKPNPKQNGCLGQPRKFSTSMSNRNHARRYGKHASTVRGYVNMCMDTLQPVPLLVNLVDIELPCDNDERTFQ